MLPANRNASRLAGIHNAEKDCLISDFGGEPMLFTEKQ